MHWREYDNPPVSNTNTMFFGNSWTDSKKSDQNPAANGKIPALARNKLGWTRESCGASLDATHTVNWSIAHGSPIK
jgi:hypothetical protein